MDSHAVRVAHGAIVPLARTDRERLLEDLTQLRATGIGHVRLTLDWPRLQPRADGWDGAEAERVLGALHHAQSLGLVIHLTLLERAMPVWFDNDGGFTDHRFALHWWPRWVQAAAEAFGDALSATGGGWVPFDNPLGLANRLLGDDPPRHGELLDTMLVAWRDAWRVLRGAAPVITAFGVITVRPTDQTIPAAEAARRQDHLRWRLWLQALRDGTISIPGRADRQLADLDGACDVLGIVVPHPDETLGAVHRAAEMGPDRPLHVTLLTGAGPDRDRVIAVQRYRRAVQEAADGSPLLAAHVGPTFDIDGYDDGIITRDRDVKDSAAEFIAPF